MRHETNTTLTGEKTMETRMEKIKRMYREQDEKREASASVCKCGWRIYDGETRKTETCYKCTPSKKTIKRHTRKSKKQFISFVELHRMEHGYNIYGDGDL